MLALLLCAPVDVPLVDSLSISPAYTVSAVYYAEGERVSGDVMTLQLDDWVILKLSYMAHTDVAAGAASTAAALIAQVCEAQCAPCPELTPAARERIDELLDAKEALSRKNSDLSSSLRTWRAVAIGVGLGLAATVGIMAAF